MLTSHGPLSMECNATCPFSGLIQYDYLTNKHHHFEKMRKVTHNDN